MTQFYVEENRPHLGGYIPGGDPATHYPDLWQWLVRDLGVQSVIDVGCGEGWSTRFFGSLECQVVGIDGVNQREWWGHGATFIQHDYSTGPFDDDIGDYDLVWSCEFVEHVAEEYVPNFLATFAMARLVLMTHAEPGQPGHHHVNCQPASYWIATMESAGFRYDDELTLQSRALAALNTFPINHFVRSGLAFVRE